MGERKGAVSRRERTGESYSTVCLASCLIYWTCKIFLGILSFCPFTLRVRIHSSLWLWPRLSEEPVLHSKVPYTPSLALKNDSVQPTSPWTCMCIILPWDQYLWEFHWSYHVCPMLDDPATLAILTSVSTTCWSWGTRMWGHRVTTSKYSFSRLIQGHGLGAAVPHSHLEVL